MADNLLDKASVILTPTAYDNGKVLCVKPSEPPYGDFDFSRNSSATRINAQGLVEDVQILSGDLVQNGDFSEEGAEEVSNVSFSQEGAEQISNGDFATDTSWDKAIGTTISDGKLNITAISTNDRTNQNANLVQGKYYKVDFEVSNYVGGTLNILMGASATPNIGNITANGIYSFYQESIGANSFFYFKGNLLDASIDNVSVREVGQDWTLGTGWSIAEDKASKVSGVTSYLLQPMVLPTPNTYKVTFTVIDYVSGDVKWGFSSATASPFGTPRTANGTYTEYFTNDVNAFALRFRAGSTFEGSITNISVKEVGQNWTLGTGWSIDQANNKATCDGTQTSTSTLQTEQVISNIQNDLVKLSFEIKDYSAGEISVTLQGTGGIDFPNLAANGVYEINVTSSSASAILLFIANSSFVGSITNISIIEITDDTNLPRINYEGFSFDGSGNIVPNSGCGSLLFEGQSTNLITQSELFSDASWFKGNSTIVSNEIVSPDGTLNASKITATSTSQPRVEESFSIPSVDTKHTFSVFVKKGNTSYIALSRFSGNQNAIFNLDTKSVVFQNSEDASITDMGNGWFRVSITQTVLSTDTNNIWKINLTNGISNNVGVVGEYVYIWGAMLEQQSYATSYIPTEGTTKTRNQDLCTNGGDVSLISSTEGTLYAEISALADDLSFRTISLSDGTTSNRCTLRYGGTSNYINVLVSSNGAIAFDNNYTLPNIIDFNKIAVSYKINDFSLWVNGTKVKTGTSGNTPIGLNTLQFVSGSGTSNLFFGKTKCVAVFKEALSDTELTELTTI